MEPEISVIMPVYNVEQYVSFAIQSILCQSFENFEFIIIDDASQDKTYDIIKQFQDPRIICLRNNINLGIAATLNKALKISRGTFVARMDGDDIAKPNRLKIQLDFMKSNPKLIISGSHMELINCTGDLIKLQKKPLSIEEVKIGLFFGRTTLAHPSIIMRKALLDSFCLRYDKAFQYAEDYDLYCRSIQYSPINNIDESLIQYRIHEESVSQKYPMQQRADAQAALYLHLRRINLPFTIEQFKIHSKISLDNKTFSPTEDEIALWFNHLQKWNQENNCFPSKLFEESCFLHQETLIKKRGLL